MGDSPLLAGLRQRAGRNPSASSSPGEGRVRTSQLLPPWSSTSTTCPALTERKPSISVEKDSTTTYSSSLSSCVGRCEVVTPHPSPLTPHTSMRCPHLGDVGCSCQSELNVRRLFWCHPAIRRRGGSDRQTDRQTDRQADRQAGRQADRQTDRQTGRQADRQTGRQADRQTDRTYLSSFF